MPIATHCSSRGLSFGNSTAAARFADIVSLQRNFGLLLTGRGSGAILGLLCTLILARALSPEAFGLLVMMHTLTLFVRGLCNTKPFEAIVLYGVRGNQATRKRLLNITRWLDTSSALLAVLLAWCACQWLGPYLNWPISIIELGQVYALILLLSGTGTAKGLLRLHDGFGVLGVAQTIAPAVRLGGFLLAWAYSPTITTFAIAWGAGLICEYAYLHWHGRRVLNDNYTHIAWNKPNFTQTAQEHDGIWPFMRAVYWQSNLDLLPKHAATLLAGSLLGASGAGLYRLAREVASILSESAVLLRQAAFVDLTRLWEDAPTDFRRKLARMTAIVTGVALLLALLIGSNGANVLELMAGSDYRAAAPLLLLLLLAAVWDIANGTLRAAAFAIDTAPQVVWLNTGITGAYLVAFYLLTQTFGLVGSGWAALLAAAASATGTAWLVLRNTRPSATR